MCTHSSRCGSFASYRPTVGSDAGDAFVDSVHGVDRTLRLRRRTERGRREEVGRALQSPPRIGAVVGVLGDSRHRQRMQRLQEQRPEAADEHRSVGVDATDRRVVGEPSGLVGVEQLEVTSVAHRARRHAIADLVTQPRAHVHCLIVPRPREYHPNVPEETSDETADSGTLGVSGTGPTDASGRRFNRRATDRTYRAGCFRLSWCSGWGTSSRSPPATCSTGSRACCC